LPLRIQANVIRISAVELSRIGINHPSTAGFAIEQPAQHGVVLVSRSARGKRRRMPEECLYAFPRSNVNDGAVFTGILLSLMANRTGIEHVSQQSPEGVLGKRTARSNLSTLGRPTRQCPASPVGLGQREDRGTILLEQSEDLAHAGALRFVY